MNAPVAAPRKIWTEADLQALPEDGFIHELANGELNMSPKNDSYHGDNCAELLVALRAYAGKRRLGAVWDSSTGFRMKNTNVRAPDISFISRVRLKEQGFKRSTRRFFPGAPDLAAEVLALYNTQAEMEARLADFFSSGTRLAWIIDPEARQVQVCHASGSRRVIGGDGVLDGENVLPGFRYPVAELFKEWDWE